MRARSSALVVAILASFGALAPAALLPARTPPPPPGELTVHEWGVLTTAEGIDPTPEVPGFVHRVPAVERPPAVIRKPIVYFYPGADGPDAVRVRVDLPPGSFGGAVHYPGGAETAGATIRREGIPTRDLPGDPGGSLLFDLTFGGPEAAPAGAPAWWEACRVPGASHVSNAAGENEGFLFYEAPLAPPAPPSLRIAAGALRAHGGGAPVHDLIAIARAQDGLLLATIDTLAPGEDAVAVLRAATPEMVRSCLHRRLTAAGLDDAEANALLAVWATALDGAQPITLYRLDPATVNALVPLTITPAPTELVRVWLVAGR